MMLNWRLFFRKKIDFANFKFFFYNYFLLLTLDPTRDIAHLPWLQYNLLFEIHHCKRIFSYSWSIFCLKQMNKYIKRYVSQLNLSITCQLLQLNVTIILFFITGCQWQNRQQRPQKGFKNLKEVINNLSYPVNCK